MPFGGATETMFDVVTVEFAGFAFESERLSGKHRGLSQFRETNGVSPHFSEPKWGQTPAKWGLSPSPRCFPDSLWVRTPAFYQD